MRGVPVWVASVVVSIIATRVVNPVVSLDVGARDGHGVSVVSAEHAVLTGYAGRGCRVVPICAPVVVLITATRVALGDQVGGRWW